MLDWCARSSGLHQLLLGVRQWQMEARVMLAQSTKLGEGRITEWWQHRICKKGIVLCRKNLGSSTPHPLSLAVQILSFQLLVSSRLIAVSTSASTTIPVIVFLTLKACCWRSFSHVPFGSLANYLHFVQQWVKIKKYRKYSAGHAASVQRESELGFWSTALFHVLFLFPQVLPNLLCVPCMFRFPHRQFSWFYLHFMSPGFSTIHQ